MSEFPTLGLKVDVSELARSEGLVDQFGASLTGLKAQADTAAASVEASAARMARSLKTINQGMRGEAFARQIGDTTTDKQIRAIQDAMRAENDLMKLRRTAEDAAQRGAERTTAFQMRMARQRARDEAALDKAVAAERAATDKAELAESESMLRLRMAMTRQQAAEQIAADREVAAAQAAADKQALAEAEATVRARVALARQRAREEAATEAQTAAAVAAAERAALAEAEATMRFRMAMTRQAAAAAIAADREVAASAAAAAKAEDRVAAETLAFRMRMWKQRGAEAAAAAREEAAAALAAEKAAARAAGAAGVMGAAVHGSSSKVRESLVLVREALRGDFTRMAGSATLLLQYMGKLETMVALLLSPVGLLTVALGAFAFAAAQGAAESARLNNMLAVTNHWAGISAGGFENLREQIRSTTDTGFGKITKALDVLLASGKVNGEALVYMGDAAVRFGELTGQSAEKAAQEMLKWADAPAKAALELHGLTAAQYLQIKALEEQGRKQEALTELTKDYDTFLKSQTHDMGLLEEAVHGVALAFGDLWEAMKKIGREKTTDALISDTEDTINSIQAQAARQRGKLDANQQGILQRARDKLEALYKTKAGEDATAADEQANTQQKQDLAGNDEYIRQLGGSARLAKKEIDELHASTERMRRFAAAHPEDAASVAAYQERLARQGQMEDYIRHKYDKADYGGGGAERTIGRLRAEVAGLQKQVDDLDSDPLSEIAAKIQKAGDAAAAQFPANHGSAYAGTAEAFARAKEELQIRLQLLDASAKAQRAAQNNAAALKLEADARARAADEAVAYYAANDNSIDGYVRMVQAQEKAETDAAVASKALAIAQRFGVNSVDEIAAAYQKATGVSAKAAQGVEDQAKAELAAEAATIRLTAAMKDQQRAQDAAVGYAREIEDLRRYTVALLRGAEAMAEFNRQKEKQQAAAARAQADSPLANAYNGMTASRAVDYKNDLQYRSMLAERLAAIQAETDDLRLTADEKDLGFKELVQQYLLAHKGATQEQAEIQVRADLRHIVLMKQALEVVRATTDEIRRAFIETGRLDFKSLKQNLERQLRKAVYDGLMKQPIDVAVNAVVNVVTQGIERLVAQLKAAVKGEGDGQGGWADKLGKLFGKVMNSKVPGASDGQTVGQFAGNMFAGMQAGQQAADMFGIHGSNKGGGKGQQMLDMAAAAIGTYFGGPLGAAVGTLISRVVGKAILGKESNHGAYAKFDATGGYTIVGDKATEQTRAAAGQIGTAVGGLLDALKKVGIDAAGVIKGIDIGSRDPTHIRLANGMDVRSKTGDVQAAIEAAGKAMLQYAHYDDPREKALVDQMIAANKSFQDIVDKLDQFIQAQKVPGDLKLALLKYTDPTQYALQSLQQQQVDRRKQIQAYADQGFYTPEQLAEINSTLSALESSEIADALAQLATGADGAAASLKQLQDAQKQLAEYVAGLKTGALSPLSPSALLAETQGKYQDALTKAQGGDLSALQNISGLSNDYLGAARAYYGSSQGYADIFDKVFGQLDALSTQPMQDPLIGALETQVQKLIDALHQDNLDIIHALGGTPGAPASSPPPPPPSYDPALLKLDSLAEELAYAITHNMSFKEVVDAVAAARAAIQQQTQAVVQTTEAGFSSLADATQAATTTQAALAGGQVAA